MRLNYPWICRELKEKEKGVDIYVPVRIAQTGMGRYLSQMHQAPFT